MKALILNGSPRKGNTCTITEALKKGFENLKDVQVKEIMADRVSVSPCIACDQCGCEGNCVSDDDTNDVLKEVMEADMIVFATPVYWWGITAQLKLIIDKFYAQSSNLHNQQKKIGVITVGEAEQSEPQYKLISDQFACICDYLGWNLVCSKSYTATAADELKKETDSVKEIEGLWECFA